MNDNLLIKFIWIDLQDSILFFLRFKTKLIKFSKKKLALTLGRWAPH